MTSLTAARVVTPTAVVAPGVIELDGDRIGAVVQTSGPAPDRTLAPGFVDLQVNGHDDVDVWTAAGHDWERMDTLLLAQGVTSWCPTLTTASLDLYPAAFERIGAAARRPTEHAPEILGVHLEGPFLGARPGAHRQEWIAPLEREWLDGLPSLVRIITLAPEADGASQAIALLADRDVLVSLGHTVATYDQGVAAADAGARLVTHLFNAMGPLGHREPGVVGAALTDDRLTVSLIADLVHVHPKILRLVFRAKAPGRVVLVTDAVAWRAPGAADRGIELRDGAPRLPEGTIAGSALTMDAAVRNVIEHAGVSLFDAVTAAATVPAALVGARDRGRIAPGARADLVALGGALDVQATWLAGRQVTG